MVFDHHNLRVPYHRSILTKEKTMKLKVTSYNPSQRLESNTVLSCSRRGAAVLIVSLCSDVLNTSVALCVPECDDQVKWVTLWTRDIVHGPDLVEGSKPAPHPDLGLVIDILLGESDKLLTDVFFCLKNEASLS